jgi:aryl-alcohol dehydrogenase-like predicted oxidoreductase
MRYRELGATGLRISEIGFGCGDNAGLFVRGTPEERCRAVELALERGINYFDTSPAYGKGLSESNLGQTLREVGAKPFVTTKVEIMPADLDDIAGAVLRSIAASLERLQLDRVDVVQIHNPPARERNLNVNALIRLPLADYLGPGGALEGLEKARRHGWVRYFGFACENAHAGAVRALIDTGAFTMLNVWYDLLNPTAGTAKPDELHVEDDYEQFLDYARAHGVGAAVIRPLAGGSLTDKALAGLGRHRLADGALTREPDSYQEMVDQARSMAFLSKPGSQTLSEAAVRFILMNRGVTTVLGGFSDVEQIEEMSRCSEASGLSPEELARLEAVWRANCGRWEQRSWSAAG